MKADPVSWTAPAQPPQRLRDARVPACLLTSPPPAGVDGEGLTRCDLVLRDGFIAEIEPLSQASTTDEQVLNLDGGMIWPGFIDCHTHLDKGHIWPRTPNTDGTFMGALNATRADSSGYWRASDVQARFDFGLACAYAHGTTAIRTHLDSFGEQIDISWDVFDGLRDKWAGKLALQAVCLTLPALLIEAEGANLARRVARSDGVLGCVLRGEPGLDEMLDAIIRLAETHGLGLDFHVDECADPDARGVAAVAAAINRHRFQGQVMLGHCCNLAQQPAEEAARTVDAIAAAGIAVVSLPMCNLFLQGRDPGRTPRWRGVTLLHELAAAGATVAVASDNCRDPFYAYGDLDMVEVFREATRIAHFDCQPGPAAFGTWPAAATRGPATAMGLGTAGTVTKGAPADLVLFRARSFTELLSRPQMDRIVLRGGAAIETTLPDYRTLDHLFDPAIDPRTSRCTF